MIKSCPQWKSIGFFRFWLRAWNKRWEATEVKILISAYKDHQENINNSKSSKGQKSVWEKIFDTFTEHCKTAGFGSLREICFTLGNHYSRITAGTTVY